MRGKWTGETLLDRAKQAEDALLSLTCSGSEFFLRDGDEYRVDVPACLAYIRRVKESQHRAIVDAITERKATEVASKALYEALEKVLADIAEYERVNKLAPNPGRSDCWDSVTAARAALSQARGEQL